MRYRIPLVAGLAAIAAGSCTSERPALGVSELDAYCAIATRADLVSWVGDIVTLCEQGEMDHHGHCTAGRVAGTEIEPITFPDGVEIRLALPASSGRLIVLLEDDRLVLTNGSGNVERELDRWASEPSVSADGERVAWIGIPDGFNLDDVGLGTPKVVAVQSLTDSARTVLVEDAMASAPRPIPMSRDVLYVAPNEDGISGFFIAGPERGATQITNVGLVDDDDQIEPVAGSPGVWTPNGALFYSVTGLESVEEPIDDPDSEPPTEEEDLENGEVVDDRELDVAHLFRLVLTDDVARVESLGEGAWPHIGAEGSVLAALPSGSSPCATTYTLEGTP